MFSTGEISDSWFAQGLGSGGQYEGQHGPLIDRYGAGPLGMPRPNTGPAGPVGDYFVYGGTAPQDYTPVDSDSPAPNPPGDVVRLVGQAQLSSTCQQALDSGIHTATVAALIGGVGSRNDTVDIDVIFLDAATAAIPDTSTCDLTGPTAQDRQDSTQMLAWSRQCDVPPGAASIYIEAIFTTDATGVSNSTITVDGCFDQPFMSVT